LTYIGYIPQEYRYFKKLPDVEFYLRVPYDSLMKLYSISDIFLFPTYADVFGFTFMEAMAYSLPIICINNNFTAPELVINGKTGYVVETSQKFLYFPFSKYCPDWISKMKYYKNLKEQDDVIGLKNLVEKLEILIRNKDLRYKLGRNGQERIISGDLSLKHRNNKLYKLFS
jgi:glycosyltransferase involved in cell wall biosynthesis